MAFQRVAEAVSSLHHSLLRCKKNKKNNRFKAERCRKRNRGLETFAFQKCVEILNKTGLSLRIRFLLRGSAEASTVRDFHPKSVPIQAVA
jgi:hypothetical protein